MSTFIRVAEIWVPDTEGHLLEFGGGLYGNAPGFGAVSRAMCFGRGEGLPGQVWDEARPVILKNLQGGHFQRVDAAKAAGLHCALAFPVFHGDALKAVVVLFCGDVEGHSGGIEVWRNDPRVSTDLKLLDGLYGGADADFEAASHETFLPRGTGLPGLAWQRQAATFMDGLTESSKFVRAGEAKTTGIRQGLAFPCPVPSNENFVLAFLSEPAMPIAARIETWMPDADGLSLKRGPGFGVSGQATVASVASADDTEQAILEAFASGVPTVRPTAPGAAAGGALIALPVVSDGVVVETVAMYF